MPTVRKVESKLKLNTTKSAAAVVEKEGAKKAGEAGENGKAVQTLEGVRKKRACYFCKSKSDPVYWDASSLRRFLSDRGRIYPRARSGACAKHQRRISKEIKRARLISLLPFSPGI